MRDLFSNSQPLWPAPLSPPLHSSSVSAGLQGRVGAAQAQAWLQRAGSGVSLPLPACSSARPPCGHRRAPSSGPCCTGHPPGDPPWTVAARGRERVRQRQQHMARPRGSKQSLPPPAAAGSPGASEQPAWAFGILAQPISLEEKQQGLPWRSLPRVDSGLGLCLLIAL